MTVLKVLGVIAFVIAIVFGVISFNEHCNKKFSYRFFTIVSFIAAAIGVWSIFGGYSWYQDSLVSGGDILNGVVIMTIGFAVILYLIYYNFKRTNLIYGIGGSVLQLGLFSVLSYFGFFIAVIGLILAICFFATAKPVYIINR